MNNETIVFWNYWILSRNQPKPLWQLLRQLSIVTGMQITQIQIKWMKRRRSAHWQCWWCVCTVSSHVICQDGLQGKKVTNLLMAQPTSQWQSPKVLLKSQCRAAKGTGQLISPLLIKRVATLLEILSSPDNKILSRRDFKGGKRSSCKWHHNCSPASASQFPLSQHWHLHRNGNWHRKLTGEELSKGAALGCCKLLPLFLGGQWAGPRQISSTSDAPQIFPCPLLRV